MDFVAAATELNTTEGEVEAHFTDYLQEQTDYMNEKIKVPIFVGAVSVTEFDTTRKALWEGAHPGLSCKVMGMTLKTKNTNGFIHWKQVRSVNVEEDAPDGAEVAPDGLARAATNTMNAMKTTKALKRKGPKKYQLKVLKKPSTSRKTETEKALKKPSSSRKRKTKTEKVLKKPSSSR
jgi:hypothetical protein